MEAVQSIISGMVIVTMGILIICSIVDLIKNIKQNKFTSKKKK
jgi:hypothetical protein